MPTTPKPADDSTDAADLEASEAAAPAEAPLDPQAAAGDANVAAYLQSIEDREGRPGNRVTPADEILTVGDATIDDLDGLDDDG